MAHESAQRARIVPAIPLKFKRDQQRRGQPDLAPEPQGAPQSPRQPVARKLAAGANAAQAPLAPESINVDSVHKTKRDELSSSQGAREAGALRANGHIPGPSAHSEPPRSGGHNGVPNGVASVFETTETESAELVATPEHHASGGSQKTNGVAECEGTLSTSGIVHNAEGEPSGDLRLQKPNSGVDSLVFGSIQPNQDSSAVTFARPRHQHQGSRSSLMANTVNAAPFFPASTGLASSELHSPVSHSAVDAPPPNTFDAVLPWYPGSTQWHAAPAQYSQPLSPSLSQHSSTREAHHPSAPRQPHVNGHNEQPAFGQGVNGGAPGTVKPPSPESVDVNLTTPSLADYVLSQFGQLGFADCLLEFYLPATTFVPVRIPAHRLLAARSPRLASELVLGSPAAEFDPYGLRIVRIWAHSKHVKAEGIIEALRHLYGAPLPTPDTIRHSDNDVDPFSRSLSLAAAGNLLEIPEVENHGLTLAKRHLSWGTLHQLYAYLRELGRRAAAAELRRAATDLIAQEFPKGFIFDTRAAQLSDAPRLPEFSGSRPSTSDPRLSRIQFGEVVESGQQPDRQTFASTLLVSLPFDDIKRVLEHDGLRINVGSSNLGHLQQAVVDERERRRIKAQKAMRRQSLAHEHQDSALLDNVAWLERLDHSFDGSLILSRSRTGDKDAH